MHETVFYLLLAYFAIRILWGLLKDYKEQQTIKKLNQEQAEFDYAEFEKLIAARKPRESTQEYDESAFWNIIDDIRTKHDNNYNTLIDQLKREFEQLSPQTLIELDNLIQRIVREGITYKIADACEILFSNSSGPTVHLLLSILITQGQAVYNNAIIEPDYIAGREFRDIEFVFIQDIPAECYFNKTRQLIPINNNDLYQPDDIVFEGTPSDLDKLPQLYPKLWALCRA